MRKIEEDVYREYEEEGIVEDLGPIAQLPLAVERVPQADRRLKILEWAAGGIAMVTAGVVVERLAHRHAHAV